VLSDDEIARQPNELTEDYIVRLIREINKHPSLCHILDTNPKLLRTFFDATSEAMVELQRLRAEANKAPYCTGDQFMF
jgi:hypothetical protein